jgi:hypothetical protein
MKTKAEAGGVVYVRFGCLLVLLALWPSNPCIDKKNPIVYSKLNIYDWYNVDHTMNLGTWFSPESNYLVGR